MGNERKEESKDLNVRESNGNLRGEKE